MPHFLGNILQDKRSAAQHPEAGDRSFDYSSAEKHDLIKQLPNLPIRFEHSEALGDVGKVRSAFQGPDGRVWVVGEISDDGIAGKFVNKTIASRQLPTPTAPDFPVGMLRGVSPTLTLRVCWDSVRVSPWG